MSKEDKPEPRVFTWPCWKRKAHGPHTIPEGEECDEIGLCADEHGHCDGVKAHPSTQIGGKYDQW